jgi:HTH-type transcriptional regulator / antitoxin HigA
MNNNLQQPDFWLASAQTQLYKINNPFIFNKEAIIDFAATIRTYTLDENTGFYQVVNFLYQHGLTVIIQPDKNKQSAILFINDKPCIVLANARQLYFYLWLNLLHELYHILFEYKTLQIQGYHVSYSGELLLNEDLADYFAEMLLFEHKKLNFFTRHAYKEADFIKQAYAQNIHPAILLGLLLKNKQHKFNYTSTHSFNYSLLSSEKALKAFYFPYWERFNPEISLAANS